MHISEQLFTEVAESVKDAKLLKDMGVLDEVDAVEIHCDAGNNGKSKDYTRALSGLIESFGFRGYLKPESVITSTLADKYTK